MLRPILSLILLSSIATLGFAAPTSAAGPRPARKPLPKYQQLKPFEDLSLEEDAAEIYDKAVNAFAKEHYDEAEKLFRKVLSLTPKNADAKYNLGAIAEWHNDLNKAMAFYKEALQLKPQDREYQKAVADVQLKMQFDQQARENKKQESLVEAGQRAKQAFSSGNYYEAARQLNQLVRIFPNEPKVQFALGQSLRALKVYEWSAYHLKMAIYLEPTDETYRRALVDLDQEIQTAQEQAIRDSAQIAMGHLRPLSGGELTDSLDIGGQLR
ncbi:MAG: tetratricopeptide repeat protein [Candidatus Obscuribacterales bacterium]|nr:tetratricopeptide repeat protein [Candidatus Obscuribacterales bacterium]